MVDELHEGVVLKEEDGEDGEDYEDDDKDIVAIADIIDVTPDGDPTCSESFCCRIWSYSARTWLISH